MKKPCCISAALLAIAALILAYKFLWQGETLPADDGRQSIILNPGERDMVLGEMRAFVLAVQQIVEAVPREDNAAIATAARRVGAAAQQEVPLSLVGKLPGPFKMLGFDTHSRFDSLALDAEQLGDPEHTLQQLAELMANCISCHAGFRIDTASSF